MPDRHNPPAPAPIDWRLLRFLARHCLTGIIASWALLLGLIWTDVGGLGGLLHSAALGWLGLLMLAAAFGLTGGAVGMGVAVMSLARKGDG
jgi:peptidoglycan biosynthesis protein MviN/MurJ (putative lipid II flippase)